ncbi:MAG: hypothetical protein EPO19_00825 [Betaproteobacteria bacterium]|nr:MAG: hypothetical protein EPO19_00825 [Betaproteobacteria bacterium]
MTDVEEQLRRQDIEPMTSTPKEFAAFLRADIRKLNPAGLVPVLIDGGSVLTESRIISEYLEDAYPQPRLSPEGAYARARMRLWTRYADEVAAEAVKLPSFVKNIQPELQRMPRAEALAAIERIPEARVRARWRKAATGGISADDLKPSIARLTEMVERMDRALQDAPWLAGDEYSLADIDIAPFVQRLVRIDLFGLVAARPRVNDWYARMTSRPAYASAMPPSGSEGGQAAAA